MADHKREDRPPPPLARVKGVGRQQHIMYGPGALPFFLLLVAFSISLFIVRGKLHVSCHLLNVSWLARGVDFLV